MSADKAARGGLRDIVRSLRYRNYRLFFAGQLVSLIGTWMQIVAVAWLVYRRTDSPFLLGLVSFSSQIPTFLFSALAGVWADRLDRRRVLLATQCLFMLQALALAGLTFGDRITVGQIVMLSVFSGLVNALDMPTRQAFLVEMIERKEDLGNAIALNSSMFNGARLIGPAVAGALVAAVGEAACFLINGLSYAAVIAALAAIRIAPRERIRRDTHALHELREGVVYAFDFGPIRAILLLLGTVSLLGMPYVVLMPVFARDILHGDATTLGWLMAAAGIGALAGAAFLASRRSVLGLGRMLVLATSVFALGLFGFAASTHLWTSLAVLVVAGFGMMVMMAGANTLLQTMADDDKRGRVMSLYTMAFMGMAPFGSLLAGGLARWIGPQATVALSGMACLAGAAVFAWRLPGLREKARPVYVRLGILPPPGAVQPTPGAIQAPGGLPDNNDRRSTEGT